MEETILTPEQKEALRASQVERFKKFGIPANAGQVAEKLQENYENAVLTEIISPRVETIENSTEIARQVADQVAQEKSVGMVLGPHANMQKMQKLEAIKRGAKKQEFQALVTQGHGEGGYQIPVPKPSKNKIPGHQPSKSESAVKPESFQTKDFAQGKSIENMFTDGIDAGRASNSIRTGAASERTGPILDSENTGVPEFNPSNFTKIMERKRADMSNSAQTQRLDNNTGMLDNNNQISEIKKLLESFVEKQNPLLSPDMQTLKETMETIAKKVAEDTIKRVLREYAEGQKNKKNFEYYNKEKNVIKIGENLFLLKPVVVKKEI